MDYEYDYDNGYGYTTEDPWTDTSQPMDFIGAMNLIQMFVILPVILIGDIILFVKIVGNKKIRREPWRWLVANASICTFFGILMLYNDLVNTSFRIPTLVNTPLCGLVRIIQMVTWYMTIVSTVILVTERFHALRLGKESKEGGMSKKSVVVSLVVFWVLLSLVVILPDFIIAKMILNSDVYVYGDYYNGLVICHSRNVMQNLVQLVLLTWAFLTFIVVIIGMAVMRNRKSTTDAMKQTIVNPTLALSVFGLLFMAICGLITVVVNLFLLHLLGLIFDMAFPMIWLITWSLNGEISMKCGGGNEGELKPLLEEK